MTEQDSMANHPAAKNTRNPNAAGINTARPLTFTFDGRQYTGFEGDTLASALLANGVKLVGRSFKYHRPRGFITSGSEEPNAIVELGTGAQTEPNTRATMIPLFDGLVANSQNRWPSLAFDINNINNVFSRFLVAGFYYKTFMWPAKAWMFYESIIRKAAGLGTATREFDPDRYEKLNSFCDVLVVGAGPAGISSALALAKQGKNVILADEQVTPGGMARYESDDQTRNWINEQLTQLKAMDNVRLMTSTTVFGAYDGGCYGALEHARKEHEYSPRLRYHRIYADKAVYATGALERPIVFGNNDLPGVMLAYALRAYVNFYGVIPGKNVVIFTNNDSVYGLAGDLLNLDCRVTVVDSRADNELCAQVRASGALVYNERGRCRRPWPAAGG